MDINLAELTESQLAQLTADIEQELKDRDNQQLEERMTRFLAKLPEGFKLHGKRFVVSGMIYSDHLQRATQIIFEFYSGSHIICHGYDDRHMVCSEKEALAWLKNLHLRKYTVHATFTSVSDRVEEQLEQALRDYLRGYLYVNISITQEEILDETP